MSAESYMIFRVGGRNCAVSVANILEVTENDNLSPLPGAPGFVVGIRKFRDEVLPVIDMVKRLSIPKVETEDKTGKYIVIFETVNANAKKRFGALVDKVLSVKELQNNAVKIVDDIDKNITPAEYIKGVIDSPDGFIYVLLPEFFFSNKDFQRLDFIMPEDFWVQPKEDILAVDKQRKK